MKVTVRALTENDREGFVTLCRSRPELAGSAAEQRAAVVHHVAFENPRKDGKPTFFVAESAGRLVAHIGRIPTLFQMGNEQEAASFGHDLYVHPDVRGGGGGFFTSMRLYRKMEAASPSYCACVWTNQVNTGLQEARNYDQAWVTGLARPINVDRLVNSRTENAVLSLAGRLGGRAALALHERAGDVARLALRRRAARVIRFDDRFDGLASRVGPKMGIAPVKSQSYLNWKYADWPGLDWEAYALTDRRGVLRGFTVVVFVEGGGDVGTIAELVADPADAPSVSLLAMAATRACRRRNLSSVICMATDPRLRRTLRAALFVPRKQKEPFFFAKADKSRWPERVRDSRAWHLSYGDSEGAL